MKKLWKKQLPAAALALIMMISLVPLAGAVNEHEHVYPDTWTSDNDLTHSHSCKTEGCSAKETQDHNYGAWTTTKTATCYQDGARQRTCSVCQYTQTEAITTRPSHAYGNWGYKDNRLHSHVCTVPECRHEETQTHTHASGDSGTISQAPTCVASGLKTYLCTICQQNYTEPIPATNKHQVNPTTGKCTVCGQQINNVGYSVNYYYLTTSGYYPSTTYKTYQVPVNSYAGSYAPSTPTVTVGGKTYTFKGWTTVPYSGSTGGISTPISI